MGGLVAASPAYAAAPSTTPPPPLAAAPSAPPVDSSYVDPARDLGATSPSCGYTLDAEGRRGCRRAGTPLHAYPLSSYGLDVRAGFSLSDPGRTFMSALQSIGAGIWMGLLYLVQGVLLLLEWALSLDLTNQAMPDARRALERLHRDAFGEPWLLAAISVAGVWGIWRGLVQRRATETMVGLAATVALIVAGMVLIAKPGETVGRAAQITNEGAISVLAVAVTGRPGEPRTALTGALRGVFDATVRDPWCALQFGSVDHCRARTGDASRPTVADVWLSYPAQSWERDRLQKLTATGKQDDGGGLLDAAGGLLGIGDDRKLPDASAALVRKAPERARMQEAGGTFPRLALLGMVTIGLSGAVALFAYIGLRLLLASAMTLLLLLIAPAMLMAPALGESGRATFVAWFKRLVGAILAKLIYGVFLAVVLVAGRVFAGLDLGWFGTWLILASFWWGVFLKRDELIGFVTSGAPRHEGTKLGNTLSQAFYGMQLARAGRNLVAGTTRPVAAVAGAVRADRADAREARVAATSQMAGEHLDDGARRHLMAHQEGAREAVGTRSRLQGEKQAVDRRLRSYDEDVAAANATKARPPVPTPEQRDLLEHRAKLRDLIEHPAATQAAAITQHADRNRALTGEEVTRADLDVHRAVRRRALEDGEDAASAPALRSAGIEPAEFEKASPSERDALLQRSAEHQRVEAELLRVADHRPKPQDLKAVRERLDDGELRQRTAAEHARRRAERRERRQRPAR